MCRCGGVPQLPTTEQRVHGAVHVAQSNRVHPAAARCEDRGYLSPVMGPRYLLTPRREVSARESRGAATHRDETDARPQPNVAVAVLPSRPTRRPKNDGPHSTQKNLLTYGTATPL
jgi:hypothetical protein